eukprot:3938579-Rhodomonas_salina.2
MTVAPDGGAAAPAALPATAPPTAPATAPATTAPTAAPTAAEVTVAAASAAPTENGAMSPGGITDEEAFVRLGSALPPSASWGGAGAPRNVPPETLRSPTHGVSPANW